MSGDADRFEAATDAFHSVESHAEGPYLHEYDGVFEETDESVRIITLAPELADNEDAVEAFERVTGQWYNANTHPNIITVVDRETTPQPWIALDQPHDITLRRVQSEPTPAEIETVVTDTAEALRTIGLYNALHGALSPGDILVVPGDDSITVQIGGFGLEHAVQTGLGEFEPTPYTAPELLEGPEQVSERTDVYGLGAITYFALTGAEPVTGPDFAQSIREGVTVPPSEYNDAVPPALDEVILQALAVQPNERYDSPYAYQRAFISAFDPADFDVDTDTPSEPVPDETQTTDTDEQSDATSTESQPTDKASPKSDSEEQTTGETANQDGPTGEGENSGISRRATLGVLGLTGLGTLGGIGIFTLGQADRGPTQASQTPTEEAGETGDSVSGSWPMFGYDVARTGHVPDETGPISDITEKWTVETDGSVLSSPAVVDSAVYVGGGNVLYAVDGATGVNEWTLETDIPSSPAVGEDTVYVGSADLNVYAVDATTGEEKWAFKTGGLVESSPVVVNSTVYVGSGDDNLYAVDAATGEEEWAFKTGRSVDSSPAVVDGTVYVGSGDGNIYAVDAATGEEEWTFETENWVHSSPAVMDGTVYVGSGDSNVYAVDTATGDEKWVFDTGNWVNSSPAVVDGTVYIGDYGGILYAVDAVTGEEEWRFKTGDAVESSPVVVDGIVYIGSYDNNLYAIDTATGEQEWAFETVGRVESSAAVVGGMVYIGSGETVYALSED